MQRFDLVVLGAGAAGLMCAGVAGQRGLKVLVIDSAHKLAEKIRISGGGRCNFTNREVGPAHFLSDNPPFCRSALARYTPQDFIALLARHRIGWHEKHKGQLFCDRSSADVIDMLLRECGAGGVARWQPCTVAAVRAGAGGGFELDTSGGPVGAARLVVATGGLSIPKLGASDFGYRLARQFGLRVIEPRPALVPFVFDPGDWAPWGALAGVALPVQMRAGSGPAFHEDLLFTHRGLSGPAALQISSYWRPGGQIEIDIVPGCDLASALGRAKAGRRHLAGELAAHLPARLADTWAARLGPAAQGPVAEMKDKALARIAVGLHRWTLEPAGTEGWRKAEVTAGGVDTHELDSRSLQSRRVPGLHFIGEVVDVTGWLGGYNFQWAWASAHAAAQACAQSPLAATGAAAGAA